MKIYPKYGEIFRKIRLQKQIKLSSFSSSGISSASVCKFETGKSMLRFDTLTSALSNLSFTLSDYENYLNSYALDEHEVFLQDLTSATLNNLNLFDFYEKAIELNEPILALLLKGTSTTLFENDVDEIIEYFEKLEFWRELDLFSLCMSLDYFKPPLVSYLLETFFITNTKMIFNSEKHRARLATVILKGILIFISQNNEELSKHFLNYFKSSNYEHTMFTKNLYFFAEGCWIYKFKENDKGRKQINKTLSIFEYLSGTNICDYYLKICQKYVDNDF
ncbi:hypothetical protein ACRPK2_07330 [Lactococcus garvieae]|uniref:Rgg family transcriptional regulator n=1 Tax=Lactococcus garvieae TaxID=1363 RepID=UPI003D7763A1